MACVPAWDRNDAGQKQDLCKLGFATSADGAHWDYFAENPVIHQHDGDGGGTGNYRPHFVGWLGSGEYLLCWSEYARGRGVKPIYGRTRDFKTVQRDPRGYANWPVSDGLVSAWREGNRLYLFAGHKLHVMLLPTDAAPARPRQD